MEQKLNTNSSAGTAADSDMKPIVIPSPDIAVNPMLADALGSLPSFHDTFMKDMYRKVTSEWDAKLKDYIQDNLKQFGHNFEDDTDFFEFCKNRIHRLAFTENPNYYEFYLDFVDADNKGTFIGSCSDKIDFKMEGNTATITIGRSIA